VLYVNVPEGMRGGKLLLRHARRDRAALEAAAAATAEEGRRIDDDDDDGEDENEDGDDKEFGGDGISTTNSNRSSSSNSNSSASRVAVDMAVLPRPNRAVAFRGDAEHCVQAYTTGAEGVFSFEGQIEVGQIHVPSS